MSDTHYIKVYEAKDGWRWYEMKSSDRVSESGEAYSKLSEAIKKAEEHAKPLGIEVLTVVNG